MRPVVRRVDGEHPRGGTSCLPSRPGDYAVEGTLFCPGAANPGEIHARQILRVLCGQIADPACRAEAEELLAQVESFAALTGAVQHDVDVWAERISQVLAGLYRAR